MHKGRRARAGLIFLSPAVCARSCHSHIEMSQHTFVQLDEPSFSVVRASKFHYQVFLCSCLFSKPEIMKVLHRFMTISTVSGTVVMVLVVLLVLTTLLSFVKAIELHEYKNRATTSDLRRHESTCTYSTVWYCRALAS